VFGDKLVAALNVGGIAAFNIPESSAQNYTLAGSIQTMTAEEGENLDTYAYGVLYACSLMTGQQGNNIYYLNTRSTPDKTDVSQGEIRTAVLDNTPVTSTTAASSTSASVSTTSATTTGSTATTSTATSSTATTSMATTGAIASSSTTGATTSSTTTTSATTGARPVHFITLTFPATSAFTFAQVEALLVRAGGSLSQWDISELPETKGKVIFVLLTDQITADEAEDIEALMADDEEFVAADGTSKVKTNQSLSSDASLLQYALLKWICWASVASFVYYAGF
jgi:hypothetical protein